MCWPTWSDQLDGIDMADSDTKGDLYEYMLGKIAIAGQNGQFRTPRHIIRLMVDMTAPTPRDVICDPGLRHGGLSSLRVRAPDWSTTATPTYKDAGGAGRHLSRARSTATTSTTHAAHRQYEHASARRGEPRYPL